MILLTRNMFEPANTQWFIEFHFPIPVSWHVAAIRFANAIFAITTASFFMFIFFYMGQSFTSNLAGFADAAFHTQWVHYPSSVRRFIQFFIMRSQRPFHLSAFGLMALTLENFVDVRTNANSVFLWNPLILTHSHLNLQLLNWIFSAFIMLRSFDWFNEVIAIHRTCRMRRDWEHLRRRTRLNK